FRLEWDIGYTSNVLAVNGDAVWEQTASVRELAGDELDRVNRVPYIFRLAELVDLAANEIPGIVDQDEEGNLVLHLSDNSGQQTTFIIDPKSYRIIRESRVEPYEEGPTVVTIDYQEYREVDGMMLPFLWLWSRPDMKMRIMVKSYDLHAALSDELFVFPQTQEALKAPYELSLATLPENIYKEDDGQILIGGWYRGWGTPYAPSESWLFHTVVNEKYGLYVEPERVQIQLFAGDKLVKSIEIGSEVLNGTRSYPVARFNSIPEIYNFRHALHEVKSVEIDRMHYLFEGRTPSGELVAASMDAAVSRYQQKRGYIFPLKGKFLIPNAHDYDMFFHTYERSQHFAYDILALGPAFELAENGGARSSDFYSFRHTEIIAPADGTIAYARNDVPDVAPSIEYLRTVENPKQAIGGNLVIIDHGEGEFSLLAHMAQGTVRVKTGDRVVQGEVLGLLGSAGSGEGFPHLHYQLQAGAGTFEDDGLPVLFDNVSYTGFFKMDGATVLSPGLPYEAK
ncbi:MAG: M23 family metallopeptidase, partial [Gammaproteobacteria bacterium]